jgi:N-formylglutamate deformylase
LSSRWPFLLTVPHASTLVPPGFEERFALSSAEVAYYADAATSRIYEFGDRTAAFLSADISRLVVDLNRSPFRLPPRYPDGVVKSRTVDGNPVWYEEIFTDRELVDSLLARYYYPFHWQVRTTLLEGDVLLGLDCHSMLPVEPPTRSNPGRERPLVCLSNNGGPDGDPVVGRRPTCPATWVQELASLFNEHLECPDTVRLNDPFAGGFISIFHHRREGIPWIQVELSRALFEDGGYTGPDSVRVDPARVEETARMVEAVFGEFADRVEEGGADSG